MEEFYWLYEDTVKWFHDEYLQIELCREIKGNAESLGFVQKISITADAQGGMIDVHDRRPVVLSPELARDWLSPDLTKDRAKEIARDCGQPAEDFEWYPVTKDVGNVRNKGEYLIKSIT